MQSVSLADVLLGNAMHSHDALCLTVTSVGTAVTRAGRGLANVLNGSPAA